MARIARTRKGEILDGLTRGRVPDASARGVSLEASVAVVERGYAAVAARERDALLGLFTDDAVWHLMDRSRVARSFEGKQAIVDFLLQIRDLRLEAIMSYGESVVAAHSFTLRSGARAITTTVYELSGGLVRIGECADVRRRTAAIR